MRKTKKSKKARPEAESLDMEQQPSFDDYSGDEQPAEGKPGKKAKKKKKKSPVALIIILVLLLLVIGGALFAGYSITNSDRNLPNIFVGDIDLGGMTAAESRAALENQGWQQRSATPLTVTGPGGVSVEIDPVKSGLTLSVDAAVSAAYTHGHDGNIVENLITYVQRYINGVDINALMASASDSYLDEKAAELQSALDEYMGEAEYSIDTQTELMSMKKGWGQIELDKAGLRSAMTEALAAGKTQLEYTGLAKELSCPDFDKIHKDNEKDPVDAKYSDDGKFDVIDEVVGCRFDVSEAEKIWQAAAPGEEIEIPLDITWPEVLGSDLRDRLFHDLLGAVTTKYPNSGPERRSNLQLATSKLNGHIMYPGDILSYNEFIGERTEEAGFKPAPAYVNGDVKDEIGGGVCQVSSTLYAASAFAFLETVERESHIFAVNYMQMGTDATVTIPAEGRAVDFKFKNSKNYPIKIVGYCNDEESTITFEIWGTLEEGDYMPVCFDNSYGWQFDYIRNIDPSYADRPGYTIKLTHETWGFTDDFGPGYRTLTHRQVIDAEGNMLVDEIINSKLANGNYAMDTYYQHNS